MVVSLCAGLTGRYHPRFVQAVSDTDDPTLPTLTFRVVFLGTIFCVLGAAASQLFFFKSNPPSFSRSVQS